MRKIEEKLTGKEREINTMQAMLVTAEERK